MKYNFLVLAVLFLLPGALIFLLRRDLRRVIGVMAAWSLPFAFTEYFFYPEYWQPEFLFDLADVVGFGLEDFVFVVGLAAFTTTAYPFVFRREYVQLEAAVAPGRRAGFAILGVTFALVGVVFVLRIPMIYGSVGIMIAVTAALCARRRDLAAPGGLGGLTAMGVYGLLCLVFGFIFPDIFALAWNTDKFLNVFVLGIPVEELLYGFAAGAAATVFYPFVTNRAFTRIGNPV